jgi:hypothetical protein
MHNNFDDPHDEEYDDIDIEKTIAALHAAWKCVPEFSLSELLDTVTQMPFCELTNAELIDALNEFVHQNN